MKHERAREEGAGQPDEGERWGCLVQDRDRRFVVACVTGLLNEDLILFEGLRVSHTEDGLFY